MPDELLGLLENILRDAALLPPGATAPRDSPIAEWLDSLARLQLVAAIDEVLDVDIEQELTGAAARTMSLKEVAVLVERLRERRSDSDRSASQRAGDDTPGPS